MDERLKEELELLRRRWPDLTYRENGRWIYIPRFSTPDTCAQQKVPVCFKVKPSYPGNAPYGFFIREPVTLTGGGSFNNVTTSNKPPFEGNWLKFSWKPADWRPGADVTSGSNLMDWVQSFYERLAEGR